MLNFIWVILILLGTIVAVGNDVYDWVTNRLHFSQELAITFRFSPGGHPPLTSGRSYPGSLTVEAGEFQRIYRKAPLSGNTITHKAELIPSGTKMGIIHIFPDHQTPPIWKEIQKVQKNSQYLLGRLRWEEPDRPTGQAHLFFEPIHFIKTQAITNDGLIHYAKVAVELSIGLIGIMALWLGLMKIAEQAGLIKRLAMALKGITIRLFPDVPPDHPAMGAMIMNISANMLGLGNAATPFGLKAMEELNKLNLKPGTATDAMCTFLVINTSNIQLIPATVIAIRAVAGSANPTEILGPVLVATFINTIIGVLTVKNMARIPFFKKQLLPRGE